MLHSLSTKVTFLLFTCYFVYVTLLKLRSVIVLVAKKMFTKLVKLFVRNEVIFQGTFETSDFANSAKLLWQGRRRAGVLGSGPPASTYL